MARTFSRVMVIGLIVIAALPLSLEVLSLEGRLWIVAYPGMVGLGYLLARTSFVRPRHVVIPWVDYFFVAIILLRGIGDGAVLPEVRTIL